MQTTIKRTDRCVQYEKVTWLTRKEIIQKGKLLKTSTSSLIWQITIQFLIYQVPPLLFFANNYNRNKEFKRLKSPFTSSPFKKILGDPIYNRLEITTCDPTFQKS